MLGHPKAKRIGAGKDDPMLDIGSGTFWSQHVLFHEKFFPALDVLI